jgi:hypothetical protein
MRLILALLVLYSFAACDAPQTGCADYAGAIQPLAREWDDANKVANATPRSALAQQIANLQAVRRKVQDIPTPACGIELQAHLVKAMDATIDGYVAFLGQKGDPTVKAFFDTARTEMDAYQAAVIKAAAQ